MESITNLFVLTFLLASSVNADCDSSGVIDAPTLDLEIAGTKFSRLLKKK